MPGFLRQATAAQVRAIGPFVDDTDFKTAETGLTIANTDIKLVINGAASANKNSGGGTHRVNGVYGLTFDATDTATVGEMQVSVVVAGALPVFDKFFVVEEAVYDALFAASAAGYGTAQTGDNYAIVNSGTHGNAALKTLIDAVDNFVDTEVADIQSRLPAALVGGRMDSSVGAMAANVMTAAAAAADLTTELQSGLATQTSVDDLPTNSELATALASADDAVLAQVALVKAKTDNLPSDPADASVVAGLISAVETKVDGIKTKTDDLTFTVAGQVDANIQYVNDVEVTGDGQTGTEWGP